MAGGGGAVSSAQAPPGGDAYLAQATAAGQDELVLVDTPGGDRRAEFTAFMAESGPALGRLALFLTGDAHRAEELVQHALVKTYEAWPRVRAGDPHAYARRVVANQRIDTWRRRHREDLTDPSALPHTPQPGGEGQHADRDELVRALRRLPARRRRVVVLRYLVGLPEAQVAADLGISVGTVKSTAARGLAQLRTLLEDDRRNP